MAWEAVTAISVAVVAILLMALTVRVFAWTRERRRLWDALERLVDVLDREGRPTLLAARGVVDDAGKTVQTIRAEVEQLAGTSRELRTRVTGAADGLEERVRDLEAVLDILQEEVEETVLDVAAALRTTRRGASIAKALKRVFLGGRR